MTRVLRKLWRYTKFLLLSPKDWRWPPTSCVVVFDNPGESLLLEYLKPWHPTILYVGGERVNVPVMLASVFRQGGGVDAYVDCFLERVRPRLVVTLIDSAIPFYKISGRHDQILTMFVQNGWRGFYGDVFEQLDALRDEERAGFKVDLKLGFGDVIGCEYARYVAGTALSAGSLKNNHIPKTRQTIKHTIAFVSQWQKNGLLLGGKLYSQEEFGLQVDRLILRFLREYAIRHDKRLLLIPRTLRSDPNRVHEIRDFSELIGEDCELLEPEGEYPSYQALDSAEIVVGVDSTMVYEAVARGKKTAIFSIRSAMIGLPGFTFGWPGEYPSRGPFWTNRPSVSDFEEVLNHLFSLSDEQWRAEVEAESFAKLMIFDPGNSILKGVFREVLPTHPERGSLG